MEGWSAASIFANVVEMEQAFKSRELAGDQVLNPFRNLESCWKKATGAFGTDAGLFLQLSHLYQLHETTCFTTWSLQPDDEPTTQPPLGLGACCYPFELIKQPSYKLFHSEGRIDFRIVGDALESHLVRNST